MLYLLVERFQWVHYLVHWLVLVSEVGPLGHLGQLPGLESFACRILQLLGSQGDLASVKDGWVERGGIESRVFLDRLVAARTLLVAIC